MFIKINVFHGSGVVGPALWIIGAAALLAAGSIFYFLRSSRPTAGMSPSEFVRLKRLVVFGLFLIGAGLAAFAFFRSHTLLTDRYEFRAPGKDDIGRIFYQPLTESRTIPLQTMNRRWGFKVINGQLQMSLDGFIETPFVAFGEGEYVLEFEASGTELENERARILTGILILEKDGTKLKGEPDVFELTPEAKKYMIPLEAVPGMIGAVRIEFLNSGTKNKNLTRLAMISNVLIRRKGATPSPSK